MTKRLIVSVMMLLFFCAQGQAQTEEEGIPGIRENVEYSQIKSVSLHISKTPDTAEGYVVFQDKGGQPCSTQGSFALSVKKKNVIGRSESVPKPVEIIRYDLTYSKQIVFKPGDFQFFDLPLGGAVYALPISLPYYKVAVGDIALLEWRDFKLEQEVTGF